MLAVIMVVVVLVIIALAAALIIPPSSQTTKSTSSPPVLQTTQSSSQGTESTSASQLSPSGLKLTLNINATIIHSSQAIDAVATVYNTLAQNTTVYPNSTQYGYVPDWGGPCHSFKESALGIAIFRGHYTVTNFSSTANPLMLLSPQAPGCPALPPLKSLEFLPHDDTANALFIGLDTGPQHILFNMTAGLYSACGTSNNGCTSTPGVKGYWTNAAFHYFEPGSYTIVAADSWGQTVYLYFEVI
jgi:hypothetical protein